MVVAADRRRARREPPGGPQEARRASHRRRRAARAAAAEEGLMFERFSDSARQAVVRAQQEASDLRAGHVGTEHLLLALATDTAGPAGRALRDVGLDADALRAAAG